MVGERWPNWMVAPAVRRHKTLVPYGTMAKYSHSLGGARAEGAEVVIRGVVSDGACLVRSRPTSRKELTARAWIAGPTGRGGVGR